MSISNAINKVSFSPSVNTTTYDFTFPFFATSDIVVKVLVANATSETTLTFAASPSSTSQFKVDATNNDTSQGGTVTIGGVGYGSGDTVVIERVVPLTQEYDLQEGASIDPTALNKALDRTVAQSQQIDDKTSKAISFPDTDANTVTYSVTEPASVRANKALGFDASGNITSLDLVSAGSVAGGNGIDVSNNVISANINTGTIEFNGGINVKNSGISAPKIVDSAVITDKINDLAVTNAKIANTTIETNKLATSTSKTTGVTFEKMQHISTDKVLGRLSASEGDVEEVTVSEDLSGTISAHTSLATAKATKAYVDSFALKYSGTTITVDNISSTFADVDLSSVTGANRSLVILTVQDGDSADELFFRTKGETVVPTGAAVLGMGAASCTTNDSEGGGTIILITDTSGVIQMRSGSDSDLDSVAIKVMGYQKMQ